MRLSDKIQKNYERSTPYTRIANELEVTAKFVGMIARGERVPTRGKGLLVLAKLNELVDNTQE